MLLSCFKPSQPQRIISGLRETFFFFFKKKEEKKRDVVEMTNRAEVRTEEQSEKAESCPEKWIALERVIKTGTDRRTD